MMEMFGIFCMAIGVAGILYVIFYMVEHTPVMCDCYESHRRLDDPETRFLPRLKCRFEIAWEREIDAHNKTKCELNAALGDKLVAQAEVDRLNKELDYLQTKYEKLTEWHKLTVLPGWSEIETDPQQCRFVGDEIKPDEAEYQDRRA